MKEKTVSHKTLSWFWRWFLNNKFVTILLVNLLILLNIFALSKISYVFEPIASFFGVIGLPIVMAGILYYLINPLIDWLEKRRVPRTVGITIVFIIIIGLIVWGVAILIPLMQKQTMSFIDNWPSYWKRANQEVDHWLRSDLLSQLQQQISSTNEDLVKSVTGQLNTMLNSTFNGLGSVVGAVTNVLVAIITMPFILFYLLKDGKNLPHHLMKAFPVKMRDTTFNLLSDMNTQISQYIRGQLTVAFFVAIMFMVGYGVIGLEYAVTLGILSGFLNLVPYLGSFLAMVPSIIIGLVTSPEMLVKVLIVFVIEQTIEGRIISPQVLGSSLEIHPVTIIVVLLTAGKLYGIPGVVLGIPGYAVMKVLATYLFNWYKEVSGLYTTDPITDSDVSEPPDIDS
ncbi:AI-2E family transporter [Carnobacterium gallinarum]|uniref:AI-2E family transporter n=1 Tax=Carnobacterium gallinarum TaxID=2749 RepID=UPI003CCC1F36